MRLPLIAACAFSALTATALISTALAEGDHKGPPPEVEAALKQCASTVAKEANGKPDRKAMRACMEAKGFKPPSGGHDGPPPGEGGHEGPPPDDK